MCGDTKLRRISVRVTEHFIWTAWSDRTSGLKCWHTNASTQTVGPGARWLISSENMLCSSHAISLLCDVAKPLYRVAGGASLDEVPDEFNYTCQLPDLLECTRTRASCCVAHIAVLSTPTLLECTHTTQTPTVLKHGCLCCLSSVSRSTFIDASPDYINYKWNNSICLIFIFCQNK